MSILYPQIGYRYYASKIYVGCQYLLDGAIDIISLFSVARYHHISITIIVFKITADTTPVLSSLLVLLLPLCLHIRPLTMIVL